MSKLPAAHEGGNPRDSWPWWAQELAMWPTGPTEADAEWAAENLNQDDGHTDEPTPDHILDSQAEEALAMDRLERGVL